jgi:uncharacterized protein YjbI with pentapeptide repeats
MPRAREFWPSLLAAASCTVRYIPGALVAGATAAVATVAGATVAGATVAGAPVARATAAGATMAGAAVAGATVAGAPVARATAAGATMAAAAVAAATVVRATLAGATVGGATVGGATLTGATVGGATGLNWEVMVWTDPVTVSVDTSSIATHAARITARVLWDYADEQKAADQESTPYRSMVGTIVFDCATDRFGGAGSISYSEDGGGGKAVAQYAINPDDADLTTTEPGTVGHDLLVFVCGRAALRR